MPLSPEFPVNNEYQVPSYRIDWEAPKRTRHAIAVFVINEGERIRRQLELMKHFVQHADIIVADGGSTDGSLTTELMKSCSVSALLIKTGPGKLSAQMRMAFAYAMQKGYEGIVTIDGNGKDGVDAIPEFVRLLDEAWDHVQGSRFVPGGHHAHTPLSRLYALKFLHAPLISWAAGVRYTDTTNGFRAYSRRFLLDPRVQPFREIFVGYELHYYLAIRAGKLGFRVCETPVSRVYPKEGPPPTKIQPLRGNWLVLKTLVRSLTDAYDP